MPTRAQQLGLVMLLAGLTAYAVWRVFVAG
jgi:hypothetical protein